MTILEQYVTIYEGHLIKVWDISSIARDLMDLQNIIAEINDKGATIQFITENLTFASDVDNPIAIMQLQMMGVFAQFERAVKRQRQLEGIAIAKDNGKYTGVMKRIYRERVHKLRADGLFIDKLASMMEISRMSVLQMLNEAAA